MRSRPVLHMVLIGTGRPHPAQLPEAVKHGWSHTPWTEASDRTTAGSTCARRFDGGDGGNKLMHKQFMENT